MTKLQLAIAHALGHYMYVRLMGWDGEVQKQRLKRLQKEYENVLIKETPISED